MSKVYTDEDFDRVCDDCRRSNHKSTCLGLGHHCPLAIIDEIQEQNSNENMKENDSDGSRRRELNIGAVR